MKRKGNKAWRKDAALQIAQELEQIDLGVRPLNKKKKRPVIHAKITVRRRNFVYRRYKSYRSVKAFEDAMRRNSVERVFIYERNLSIEKK